jgi:NAD(P)-dependent dehydrogenase (short-subunit alcohol dehydrogenase family)
MHPAGASKEIGMSEVTVVIGAGSIGQAIARRVSAGKHVLVADLHQANADAAAEVLNNAGFQASTATVDVSSRESLQALVKAATRLGDVTREEQPAEVIEARAPVGEAKRQPDGRSGGPRARSGVRPSCFPC